MSEALPPLIEVKGLKHSWGEGFVLQIDEWRVAQGSRVALIGASGAGKSTLLSLLAGALEPQAGILKVLGAPLHELSEGARRAWRARHVGLLSQRFAHIEHLSALEGCALPVQLHLRPEGPRPYREELDDTLSALQLSALAHKRPSQLSQGEQQRFALARALLAEPPLILADEPTAHLDPLTAQETLALLQKPRDLGGLVVVTHDHELLDGFDEVWRLEEGGLRRVSTSQAHPAQPHFARVEEADTPKPSGAHAAPPPLMWGRLAYLGLKASAHYWGRSLALALSLALTASLPLGLSEVGGQLEQRLLERAQASPLLLGAPGSRFDLTLRSLYFKGEELQPLAWRDLKRSYQLGGVQAAPLHLRFSARGAPLVGTTVEYYELRGLTVSRGRLPQRLGEVTIGATLADRLSLRIGDRLMSDQQDLYNLAATYPVELEVVGLLERARSPDDEALFTDVKTCWVIEGRGHGHAQAAGQQGAELVIAQRLSGEGAAPVHFHGDMGSYPISSLLITPQDERAGSLFKARAAQHNGWHVTTPSEVIHELLKVIFRVKGLLGALGQGALALTLTLGALIAWLSFSLRASEWRSLGLLGLSRAQVAFAGTAELIWVMLLATLVLLTLLSFASTLEGLAWTFLL